jgi:hypothetical protein
MLLFLGAPHIRTHTLQNEVVTEQEPPVDMRVWLHQSPLCTVVNNLIRRCVKSNTLARPTSEEVVKEMFSPEFRAPSVVEITASGSAGAFPLVAI